MFINPQILTIWIINKLKSSKMTILQINKMKLIISFNTLNDNIQISDYTLF